MTGGKPKFVQINRGKPKLAQITGINQNMLKLHRVKFAIKVKNHKIFKLQGQKLKKLHSKTRNR